MHPFVTSCLGDMDPVERYSKHYPLVQLVCVLKQETDSADGVAWPIPTIMYVQRTHRRSRTCS